MESNNKTKKAGGLNEYGLREASQGELRAHVKTLYKGDTSAGAQLDGRYQTGPGAFVNGYHQPTAIRSTQLPRLAPSPHGSYNPLPEYVSFGSSTAHGTLPVAESVQPSTSNDSQTTAEFHHNTNFSAFGMDYQPQGLESPNRQSSLDPSIAMVGAQRLAQQFGIRHGDLGDGSGGVVTGLDPIRDERLSGVFRPDGDSDDDSSEASEDATHDGSHSRGGVARGRGQGMVSRGRGKGRGSWRRLLKGTEHENVGKTNHSSISRVSNRGRGRGKSRKGIDPGRHFKTFMQQANKAYMENDLDGAADLCRQAVEANPEVYGAHSLLSEILKTQGRDQDSLEALRYGAVTTRNADVWVMVAQRYLDVPTEKRSPTVLRLAVECYSEALKVNRQDEKDFDLRAAKYELYRELGEGRHARLDCRNILRFYPHRTYYVAEYAKLCSELQDKSELKKAIEIYDAAIEYWWVRNATNFRQEDEDPNDDWTHLNIYLDLMSFMGSSWEGIRRAKRMARWFLGRKEETFWDYQTHDDREFDIENDRRAALEEWVLGQVSRDDDLYGQGLPIEIRIHLGKFRMNMGPQFIDEAKRHFQPLLALTGLVDEYLELFVDVATCYREVNLLQDACAYYDPVLTCPDAEDPRYGLDEITWMTMGACYQSILRNEDAIACFEVVISRKGESYGRASARLARLYEEADQLDKARFICSELINAGRHDLLIDAHVKMVPDAVRALPAKIPANKPTASNRPKPDKPKAKKSSPRRLLPGGTLPPRPKHKRISKPRKASKRKDNDILSTIWGEVFDFEQEPNGELKRPWLMKRRKTLSRYSREGNGLIEDTETRVHANYGIIRTLWPALREGNDQNAADQWLEAAVGLLEDFTSMRVFFPDRDKYIKIKQTDSARGNTFVRDPKISKEAGAPQGFLSIPFAEWHRVFSDLALYFAHGAEQDKCYRVLQDVLFGANVFYQNPDLKWAGFAVCFHCALVFNDSQYTIDLARNVVKEGDWRSGESFALFAALNRFSVGSNWFSAGPTQKFMLRQVKAIDFLTMQPELRKRFDWSLHKAYLDRKAKDLANVPQKLQTGVLLTYGHMVAVANHSFSALPYYYRALALQPNNICVNLSIAAMWIQNSMKRQTENRQFGISQGLGFLYRYYELRTASAQACHLQEAEYNVARMWHYLGLTHLAFPAYEKVLALSEHVQREALEEGKEGAGLGGLEDFAQEAAFALQGIYSLAGNDGAARRVTEEWLTI